MTPPPNTPASPGHSESRLVSAPPSAPEPIRCDGCAREATAAHLRDRIARLECASRFRPIHISLLFLTLAPPARLEDYFYFPQGLPSDPAARALVEDLLLACGIAVGGGDREPALREFQRRGFHLAEAIECPLAHGAEEDVDALLARLVPTLQLRLRYSYRPKAVLLLSPSLRSVGSALASIGEPDLPLTQLGPLSLADPGDEAGRELMRNELRKLLAGARSFSGEAS